MTDLSRLVTVPVREVWRHEAHDFTTWMLANADVLAGVLGMELELTAAEHPVGGFSLDLIGEEVGTGNVVIVENQLEQTDHGHLGQIMTYAGGTDPQTVVWCAPSFRDEHRAALDWLNERTDENTRFFGVEVSAVRIDNSRPAPLFRLVVQPNDWAKQVHAETTAGVSPRASAYAEFWSKVLNRIREVHPDWSTATGSKSSWITLPYGTSIAWYSLVCGRNGPRVELYFSGGSAETNLAEFERVAAYEDQILADVGPAVKFDPLPELKSCRIHIDHESGEWFDVLDRSQHEALITWFIATFERFRPATQRVKSQVDGAEAGAHSVRAGSAQQLAARGGSDPEGHAASRHREGTE